MICTLGAALQPEPSCLAHFSAVVSGALGVRALVIAILTSLLRKFFHAAPTSVRLLAGAAVSVT